MSDTASEILCYRCMTWHDAPMCDHDPTRGCLTCGKPRGYRFPDRDGSLHRAVECAFCAHNLPRAA